MQSSGVCPVESWEVGGGGGRFSHLIICMCWLWVLLTVVERGMSGINIKILRWYAEWPSPIAFFDA